MSVYCLAQVLPTHIIQTIAEFLQDTRAERYYNKNLPTTIKAPLIPLMGVCRHWNAAISSLFYHSATLGFGDVKASDNGHKPILTLDDVATMDKLPYLRMLKIDISGMGFAELSSDYVSMLKKTLNACGPLVKVNEITLGLKQPVPTAMPTGQLSSDFAFNAVAMDEFEARLSDFVDCFHQLFPSKRILNMHMILFSPVSTPDQSYTRATVDMLPKLFGHDIQHFSLSKLYLTEQMVSSLQACALCRIELITDVGSDQYTELIRRNRTSLEYLLLKSPFIHWAPNIIGLMDNDGDRAPVYPRLKTLHLSYCYINSEPEEMTCSVNPFPVLEVLTCRVVNHSALIQIIEHIQLTVRVMELNIDDGQIDWLTDHKIFKAGSFGRLESLLLVENANAVVPMHTAANRMLVCALNMSPVARSVSYKIYRQSVFSEGTFTRIIFSENLRFLDLGYTFFTISQAVQLFSGFNRLHKATLRLKEESTTRSVKMPAAEEIQQFRTRFKGLSSSLRIVQISTTSFFCTRRAGEYIVLMTDALPNVDRVVIRDDHDSSDSKIMNAVKLALKRSVYKNDVRLNNVVYSAKDFWSH